MTHPQQEQTTDAPDEVSQLQTRLAQGRGHYRCVKQERDQLAEEVAFLKSRLATVSSTVADQQRTIKDLKRAQAASRAPEPTDEQEEARRAADLARVTEIQRLQQGLRQARDETRAAVQARDQACQARDQAQSRMRLLEVELMMVRLQQTTAPMDAGGAIRATLVKALTKLATEVHPDRWQDNAVATEVTKLVLALRDRLKRETETA